MILRSLEIENFRIFQKSEFEFGERLNVVYGPNGQGKTTLLEAISVTCLTKSFRTRQDTDLIRHGQTFFRVVAHFRDDMGVERTVEIRFDRSSGKRILLDRSRVISAAEHVGTFPVVVLSPDDDEITMGPPERRRRFINIVLSQLDRSYLALLQEYVRVLKQRNAILQEARESRFGLSKKVEPWNQKFFQIGREITNRRARFVEALNLKAAPILSELTTGAESLEIRYEPSFRPEWDSYEKFSAFLDENLNLEIVRGTSLFGPHRDEVLFLLNGVELRRFGSRGQHRSCLLALKIAEYRMLLEGKGESPIFLLDDVYGEIDEFRERALNDYFGELRQVFITSHQRDIKFNISHDLMQKIHYIHMDMANLASQEEVFEP